MEATPASRLGPGKWGLVFASIWLVYLVQPAHDAWVRYSLRGWIGIAGIAAYVVLYLAVLMIQRGPMGPEPDGPDRRGLLVVLSGAMLALASVICWSAGETGLATVPYLSAVAVVCLPIRWGWVAGALVGIAGYSLTVVVPGWHPDQGILFGSSVATLAVWGIKRMVRVRAENAHLELQEERNRFARDLHDILGHSLTVITVKAELAGKLLDVDPERARLELSSLEQLARDALADVRSAVGGYRQVTLPGELANARAALAAAEIDAELPNSTDGVAGDLRELFAWVVREGVTNVIRHSGATECVVSFDERSVEVRDNGRGGVETPSGHGLRGLRERAALHNATVVTESLAPGFALRLVVA